MQEGAKLKLAETAGGISIPASPRRLDDRGIRLLLVDDDPLSRSEVLEAAQAADIQVVGCTDNGQHALELVRLLRPDLALISWNMRRFGGALTASLMQRYAPEVAAVLLLEPEDIAEVRNAPPGIPVRSLMKHGDAGELRATLRAIHRHGASGSGFRTKEVVDVRR
jgi:DNA-binding NarL/FixJ family response regulator